MAASPDTLAGLMERVTYYNPENGFAVLRVKVKGHQDVVTVVGNLPAVTVGEHMEATGRWVVDREHGQHPLISRRLPLREARR